MTTKASDILVRCLEEEGVEYVFGLPGEEIMDLLDSLSRSRIRFVTTRHEQGAAFMANAYGRLTGRAGVCLSTLGPGATNLVTGIADAYLDRAPLVAITGQAGLERRHKESHQHLDVLEMFRPITKWNACIGTPEVIPEVVRKAFKTAQLEKPGPCHIELPEDIAAQEVGDLTWQPLQAKLLEYPAPNPQAIQRAANLIAQARYPIILAGNGVVRRRASPELTLLAERLQIPVAHTFMGKGSLNYRNPLSLLEVGLQARDWVMCGFDRADLVIAVGYDMAEYAPQQWNPEKDKHIIHIDTLPSEVDERYQPEAEVVAEIGQSLKMLAEALAPQRPFEGYRALRETILRELERHTQDQAFPMKPQRVVADVRHALGEEDILLCDVGAHKIWVARMYPACCPNTVLLSNGLSPMGFALPAAVAAKLVHPERKVALIIGDGGFLMNAQELETAKRLGAAFVTIIWVDNSYGLIEWKQNSSFGAPFGVSFGNPNFVKYAEAFGLPGFKVNAAAEFLPLLRRALDLELPSIIEVPIDYAENYKLIEELGQLTCPL